MQLRTVAEVAIASSGLGIAPDCQQQFWTLLDTAEAQVAGTPQRRAEAVQNLLQLIAAMISRATAQSAPELHEWSLTGALATLCPLWPFC